jgi:hypothetical protein
MSIASSIEPGSMSEGRGHGEVEEAEQRYPMDQREKHLLRAPLRGG